MAAGEDQTQLIVHDGLFLIVRRFDERAREIRAIGDLRFEALAPPEGIDRLEASRRRAKPLDSRGCRPWATSPPPW